MKTPITYYGGKQKMSKMLVGMLWKERAGYIEPFFGGGAVFFAKEQEKFEVINDINDNVINFYEVMQRDFDALNERVQSSLYSESLYTLAHNVYFNPCLFDKVTCAWAFWYLSKTSFGGDMMAGFSYSKCGILYGSRGLRYCRDAFYEYKTRLDGITIRNMDAIDCIKTYDNKGAFFYIDPPYVGAQQGHYCGYKQEDFNVLLDVLSGLQGKFLLSSYHNDVLDAKIAECGWHAMQVCNANHSSAKDAGVRKSKKIEWITSNYEYDKSATLL